MKTVQEDTLNELIKTALKFRKERDWEQFHTPKDLAMDINIEASEVLEHFLWKNEKEINEYVKTHKEKIADEISDVLHALLLLSYDLKIDLKKTFYKKMEENAKKYPVEKAKGNLISTLSIKLQKRYKLLNRLRYPKTLNYIKMQIYENSSLTVVFLKRLVI